MSEEEPADAQELMGLLGNPELLRFYGLNITPKGAIALVAMRDLDMPTEEASRFAQTIEDTIFLAGWIYVREEYLRQAMELNESEEGPDDGFLG